MSPRKQTLARWLVEQRGLRQGGRILAFIVTWAIAQEDLDRERLNVEEYADYWNEAERTSYRDLERFRDTFEAFGFRDPSGLIAVIGGSERVPGFSMDQLTRSSS